VTSQVTSDSAPVSRPFRGRCRLSRGADSPATQLAPMQVAGVEMRVAIIKVITECRANVCATFGFTPPVTSR